MDFKKEADVYLAGATNGREYDDPRELLELLKKTYLAGARAVFGATPAADSMGWLTFQPKAAMIVTSRDPEEQEEQLAKQLKRTLLI